MISSIKSGISHWGMLVTALRTPVMINPVETPDEVESPTVYVGPNNFVFVSASHRGGGALPPRHIFTWGWQ